MFDGVALDTRSASFRGRLPMDARSTTKTSASDHPHMSAYCGAERINFELTWLWISCNRAVGCDASKNRIVPPAFTTDIIPTTAHADLGKHSSTMTSGPTPRD